MKLFKRFGYFEKKYVFGLAKNLTQNSVFIIQFSKYVAPPQNSLFGLVFVLSFYNSLLKN